MNTKSILLLILLMYLGQLHAQETAVSKFGQLRVEGSFILGEKGDTVQLSGMSLFWSQWMGAFYNARLVKWLRDDWHCTVVRAAMGVEQGGYIENPYDEVPKIKRVVEAAIKNGLYVIIDYHSHEAHKNPKYALKFFAEMAKKYGHHPNVIYEIYNEPLQDISWHNHIKPYAELVIAEIRKYDPDNLIVCGTRQWSQLVNEAAKDRLSDKNTLYTLHYYAASHGQSLRDEAELAIKSGIAIMVTEFGTCEYTGDGKLDKDASNAWWDFLQKHKISWCNWAISDKNETAAVLKFGTNWGGGWKEEKLTESGKFVRNKIRSMNASFYVK